jgi:hypothetical protein
MDTNTASNLSLACNLLGLTARQTLNLIGYRDDECGALLAELPPHGTGLVSTLPPPTDLAGAREQYLEARERRDQPRMVTGMYTWLSFMTSYEEACEALLWARQDEELSMVIAHLPQLVWSGSDYEDALHVADQHPSFGVRARLFEQLVAQAPLRWVRDLLHLAQTEYQESLVVMRTLEQALPAATDATQSTQHDGCVVA